MIAWAVIASAAVLIALFFVPVDFAVSAGTGTGFRLRASWLFGLIRLGGGSPAARKQPRIRKRRPRRGRRKAAAARHLLAIEGLPARTARLARDLLGTLRWRDGSIALRGGLGDPADTGELCGIVACLRAWLPPSIVRVEFEPDFFGSDFAVEAKGSGRVAPAHVIGALARFALSRPGRRAVGLLVWARAR
jgi:hypothetical protein